MLGIWPLGLCIRLLCVVTPGQGKAEPEHSPTPDGDPAAQACHPEICSRFLPSLFHLPGLGRALAMSNTSPRDVLLGLRRPTPLKSPSLAQDAPEMRPPCSDSPAAGEAKIWVSLRGK